MAKELSLEEKAMLAKAGDESYMKEICESFLPLAKKLAGQSHVRRMYEDVYARLLLSLVEAVREYDAAKGIFFAAFVAAKLRYAVWNIFKKERRVWQNTISDSPDENGITLLEKISTSQSPEGDFVEKDVAARLKKGVAELSPLQRCVVEKLFFENKTLAEVGGELGVSPQAVYGIKLRALNNLRRRQDFKDLW